MWLIAALNTVEPPIVELEQLHFFGRDKPWRDEQRAEVVARVRTRLTDLAARLGNADWLDGGFTAGDLMMVMVLRRLDGMGIGETFPALAAYVARGEARPAYQRAFAAQKGVFDNRSTGEGRPG